MKRWTGSSSAKRASNFMATLTRNTVQVQGSEHPFEQLTVPTELQRTAFELLQVKLAV